jgi:glucose-6-phosphate isomerase
MNQSLTDIWQKLSDHYAEIDERDITILFERPERFERFSRSCGDLLLDFSKTNLDEGAMWLLKSLAAEAGLPEKIKAMFNGDKINTSEDRAVLHTALRAPTDAEIIVDGQNVVSGVQAVLDQMSRFATALRTGAHKTQGGEKFTDVVNIGIGGSDLGPAMATLALAPYHDGPACHFVSNVDGAHIHDTLRRLDPKTTLIVIASKTFTTIETMTNAKTAIKWLQDTLGEDVSEHLAAVSTAQDKTEAMGIPLSRVFGFEDWVGGRYSMWGPIGLPIMIAVGPENFQKFLAGAAAMDDHFRTAPLDENLPALLGMIGIWHNNICGYHTRAVLPYDQRLARLPAYIQQLDMESNGKSARTNGDWVQSKTGPIVWGEPGTNGQHAFYQLLHQGTYVTPAEFLIAKEAHEPELAHQHTLLKANCLAQSEALMLGRSKEAARDIAAKRGFEGDKLEEMAGHFTFPGNRPSLTLAYPKLTPFVLGQIVALYEHRVFTESVIWDINPFDQWGVELGKELALSLHPLFEGGDASSKDGSTQGLLKKLI